MRAYVSLRGSRSPRTVNRDASWSIVAAPYVLLGIGHPNGSVTSFEIAYLPVKDSEGNIIGAKVALTRDSPDEGLKTIHEEIVTI